MATNLNPFCSNRFMISPTIPRWTASGLSIIKVLSVFPLMIVRNRSSDVDKVKLSELNETLFKFNFTTNLTLTAGVCDARETGKTRAGLGTRKRNVSQV